MRVLGIDCGTERTGYGVIDSDGRVHRFVAAGCIRSSSKDPLEKRLLNIARELRVLFGEYLPDHAAVEEVFFAVNAKSALKLSHVRGVALLTVAEAAVEFAEYSPLEVKMSVVGYGRAEKSQVQQMVASLLRLPATLRSEDASDALAIAICHATHLPMLSLRLSSPALPGPALSKPALLKPALLKPALLKPALLKKEARI